MKRQLHIARVENELGALTDSEAVEMLRGGFLSPDDLYRADGAMEWKPLPNLTLGVGAEPVSALNRAQRTVAATGNAAISQAIQYTQMLKKAALRGSVRMTDSARGLFDSYTPQIRRLVANQLVQRSVTDAKTALHDDEFMRKVFGATYDCLPKPIHRFITEQAFIEFCLERRQRLMTPSAPVPGEG